MESTASAQALKSSGVRSGSGITFRYVLVGAGPLLFFLISSLNVFALSSTLAAVLGIGAWMLVWWITEAVAIPVTALLPVILFPVCNVLDLPATSAFYSNPIVLLFLSGFVFAIAMERHQLHVRIALHIVKWVGTETGKLVLGFMIATAFISMWVNNTAATLLMLPIATSVVSLLKEQFDQERQQEAFNRFAISVMLGVAYAASIGGIATIIGTPTNAVLVSFLKERYDRDLDFARWMIIGFPMAVTLLFIAYFIITKIMYPIRTQSKIDASATIEKKISDLGNISFQEVAVTTVFILTAMCWIFRPLFIQLSSLKPVTDTTIGLVAMTILFIIPNGRKKGGLLSWNDLSGLPWGILLLIGGGMALAKSLEVSGLIKIIGEFVASGTSDYLSLLVILAVIALTLKQFMGNVALATLTLPMVFGIADATHIDPVLLGAPITFAASFAFMLPMSTPPNAIVFTTSYVKMRDLILTGGLLVLSGGILLIAFYKLYPYM